MSIAFEVYPHHQHCRILLHVLQLRRTSRPTAGRARNNPSALHTTATKVMKTSCTSLLPVVIACVESLNHNSQCRFAQTYPFVDPLLRPPGSALGGGRGRPREQRLERVTDDHARGRAPAPGLGPGELDMLGALLQAMVGGSEVRGRASSLHFTFTFLFPSA